MAEVENSPWMEISLNGKKGKKHWPKMEANVGAASTGEVLGGTSGLRWKEEVAGERK